MAYRALFRAGRAGQPTAGRLRAADSTPSEAPPAATAAAGRAGTAGPGTPVAVSAPRGGGRSPALPARRAGRRPGFRRQDFHPADDRHLRLGDRLDPLGGGPPGEVLGSGRVPRSRRRLRGARSPSSRAAAGGRLGRRAGIATTAPAGFRSLAARGQDRPAFDRRGIGLRRARSGEEIDPARAARRRNRPRSRRPAKK